jgi:hypothetical protein
VVVVCSLDLLSHQSLPQKSVVQNTSSLVAGPDKVDVVQVQINFQCGNLIPGMQ